MERGPLALFGAIVAVGLGPSLWLGAHVSSLEITSNRPPATVSEQNRDSGELLGGSGAGAADSSGVGDSPVRATPRADIKPLTASSSATPSRSASAVPSREPSATPSKSVGPSRSGSPSPSPSATTTEPTRPSSGGTPTADPTTVPPAPPPSSGAPGEGGKRASGSGSGAGGGSTTAPTGAPGAV